VARETVVAQIDKETWWERNGGNVIFAGIIALVIILISVAGGFTQNDYNTPDCPGGGEYCNQ